MVSLNPILRVQNYFVQTWNKQNPETLRIIVKVALVAIALPTAGVAAAGLYGTVKVFTSVVATSIGLIALFILNHATQKTKPVDSEKKIKKITQCEFIVDQNDLNEAKEIVISDKGQVKINAAQYQILSKCKYFKAMLDWDGIHKDETIDFARVIDNMNVWIEISRLKKIESKEKQIIESTNLLTAWKIKLNVSNDLVALNLVGGKIQRGINALVENLYQADHCDEVLKQFWQQLLILNVDLDIKNEDLIKSLVQISQYLNLRIIPAKLFHFLLEVKDHKAVEQLMKGFEGELTAKELKSSSIEQFNIDLDQKDVSEDVSDEGNPSLNTLLSKFTCDTLVIDSYIDIGVIEDTYFLQNIKNFIIKNEVTNRILGGVIHKIVNSENVEKIDFSHNTYFDNGHSEHEAVLLKHGFVRVNPNEKIFVKTK